MKILIDTCVALDFLFRREVGGPEARDVFLWASSHNASLFLSAKQMSDMFYIVHRHYHDKETTREAIKSLLNFVTVLDTTGPDTIIAFGDQGPDYEDSILIEVAQRSRIDVILTQDLAGFIASPIPVYSPAEFLKKSDSFAH